MDRSSHSAGGAALPFIPSPRESQNVIVGGLVVLSALIASYTGVLQFLERTWRDNPDYSYGYFVPLCVAYLLWTRWKEGKFPVARPHWSAMVAGAGLIALAAGLRILGIQRPSITLEALSLIPCLSGAVLFCGGWQIARWSWAPLAFLLFMVPLPRPIAELLSSHLQSLATILSTFFLQMFGIPAVSEGNIIMLSNETIGVADACSGLRMFVCFLALTVGMCLLTNRPAWERIILLISAPLIAIVANVTRIVATGIAYEAGGSEAGKLIFHDLAGWLMMPLGLGLLFAELSILSRLVLEDGPRGMLLRAEKSQ